MDYRAKRTARMLVPVLALCMITVWTGCDSSPAANPDNLPADHTVRNGGVLHKSGYNTPVESGCTNCHGSDLKGGTAEIDGLNVSTPSCFSCHGQKWR